MSFASLAFLGFFAIVFSLHWLARGRLQNQILLAGSYVFYAWLTPWYAILLAFSSVGDFYLSHRIHSNRAKLKLFLGLSLALNLGVLGFFKYYDFFNTQVAESLTSAGLSVDWLFIKIALPAGLSFYTLKKLAYIFDVSRGQIEPSRHLTSFLLFVSFFPQLAAGPIDRYQNLAPQIERPRTWKADFFHSAWSLLVTGFFKKIVIANTIQPLVDRVFGLEEPSKIVILAGAFAFTLQILADFSAYTDLSRGFAKLLGFETPENFNRPYLALTPTDFWNRWHITLSAWLRDYIFYPTRRALMRSSQLLPSWIVQVVPPLATMLISGLWHGAGSNFVIWGLYYGLLIVVYQSIGIHVDRINASRLLLRLSAWAVMFLAIVGGWLIFRAPSIGWLAQIVFYAPWAYGRVDWVASLIIISMTVVYSLPMVLKLLLDRHVSPGFVHSFYHAGLTAATVIYLGSATTDFIYFQF